MKSSLRSYILNFVVIIGLTAVSLWFALKDNYHEIMHLISSISWYWLLIIFLWGMIYVMILGQIIMIFARRYKKDYTYRQGLSNALVGTFFSGITPSATGGQFGQAYVFKKQGIKYSDGASILWADFIVYQTTMMVYVTILFLLRYTHYMTIIGPAFLGILIGYIVNVCVISILWTMALFPRVYVKLSGHAVTLLAKLHIVKNKEKTLAAWTIQFSLPFFIAYALNLNLGLDKFVDCLALASFVLMTNAFIPIPGASGGTELVFVQLFKYLVGGLKASGIMILWRFSTYHIVILVGAFVFLHLKRTYDDEKYGRRKKPKDIREVDS